ncbi:DUF1841 family protein [Inmirania thermothiophila]|uniref:Uncharacterized protein DUF1841 n=1 Tax=Inmirania thermothiophila TaxID=1750597 RepID=A0A3N1Y8A7_9GAMM|nr:DUF1841 family protein [Inmirania thermothiophila]ROR35049.1 uncharacterized protein DUF1841 [Inmirania thermothiophila]
MFTTDRTRLRRYFREAWRRHCAGEPLEPLQRQIAGVVARHPEYHRWLEDEEALARDFHAELGEANPFLHLSLHLALEEQLATDRPRGIVALYRRLLARSPDAHAAEHRMMECLARTVWEAQQAGREPDEADYLACLRGLLDEGG